MDDKMMVMFQHIHFSKKKSKSQIIYFELVGSKNKPAYLYLPYGSKIVRLLIMLPKKYILFSKKPDDKETVDVSVLCGPEEHFEIVPEMYNTDRRTSEFVRAIDVMRMRHLYEAEVENGVLTKEEYDIICNGRIKSEHCF